MELSGEVDEPDSEEKMENSSDSEARSVESELPERLEELLHLLEFTYKTIPADKKAVTSIPRLDLPEYGEFFREEEGASRSLRKRTDFERKVRLQVLRALRALGRCATIREFDNSSLHLTIPEWEALLIPLKFNSVLGRVTWRPLESAVTEAMIGPHWRRVFTDCKTIKVLELKGSFKVREDFAAQVSSGLAANRHEALVELTVGQLEDAGVLNQVAEMIWASPGLRHLTVWDLWAFQWDKGAKRVLSKALRSASYARDISPAY